LDARLRDRYASPFLDSSYRSSVLTGIESRRTLVKGFLPAGTDLIFAGSLFVPPGTEGASPVQLQSSITVIEILVVLIS
jgi:hypothetical protein